MLRTHGIKYLEFARNKLTEQEFAIESSDSLCFMISPSKREMQFFCEHQICLITLADVLAAHDNKNFLKAEIPLLISTIENCYKYVYIYGTSQYALHIRDYLKSNSNIVVMDESSIQQNGGSELKSNAKKDSIILVIDLLPPGSIHVEFPVIYWVDMLHGMVTDSSKDIIRNITPTLQNQGIKVLYVTSPNRFAFKNWPIVFMHMLRYESIKERNQQKAIKKTLSLFRHSDLETDYYRLNINIDKGFPQITARGEFINYDNGYRTTVGNQATNQHKVYLFGPCIVVGAYVKDSETIPSFLQSIMCGGYSVINRGACNDMGENLIMRSTTYHSGDIAIVFTDKYALKKWGTNLHLQYDLTKSYRKIAKLEKHISDGPYHCDDVVNKQIAQDLFDCLSSAGFFTEEKDKKSTVFFGSRLKRIPQFQIEKYSEIYAWQKKYADYRRAGKNGAIVMNCNPFTLGHKYLIETAAKEVDNLYVFIVEEDKSYFPFEDRLMLVREGVAEIRNVIVLPSGRHMISNDTLPGYFTKEMLNNVYLDASYDMELFMQIASYFKIVVRYVGKEPYDLFTRQYNENMKAILPVYYISVVEIERKMINEKYISASLVRKCIEQADYKTISELVPQSTQLYLEKRFRNV